MPPITSIKPSATIARTVTVGTTSGILDIAFATTNLGNRTLTLTNLDVVNNVWVTWLASTAVVEGDDNIVIRPGESVSISPQTSIYGVAVSAPVKVHAWLTV